MSKITNRIFLMLSLSLLAAAFAGCGSGNKEGSALGGTVATVDQSLCIGCHSSWTEDLTGDPIVANYLASVHNTNSVGCQDCHGGGAMHNGVGPIPYPSPNHVQCATCHDSEGLVTAYAASKHYNVEIRESSVCNRCHTHQGAVLGAEAGFTGDGEALETTLASLAPGDLPTGTGEPIKCNTCHVTHKPQQLRVDSTWAPSTVVGSVANTGNDQYKLCTQCHTYINPSGVLTGSGTTTPNGLVTVEVGRHNTSWYRIIASTHYDNPATSTVVEGYVPRTNGTNPCFDCHNHEANTNTCTAGTTPADATIYSDWAQSAHAGGLLTVKYDAAAPFSRSVEQVNAVMDVGVNEATGAAWVHYNWDQTTGSGNRASCQRCHTSTGASNFMTNPTTYVAANNTFNHLSGWTAATGSPQNELLYCWGCHSDPGKGVLRNPGAITETYSPATTGDPATTVSYPNVSGSNTCMSCHLGRETGEVIKNDQDADGIRNFVNSHYLTAGGQLFGTTGYEYTGQDYANPSSFAHDKVGSTAAPGTGTNGPCAGCHMQTPNSHSFLPVTKDSTGTITAITSTSCVSCHGTALTPAGLTTEEEEYQAALEALKQTLNGKGIYFYEAHPYFYTAPYVVGGTNTGFTNWASIYGIAQWKNVMGAAFNYNLLFHDPGGYAHNRFYSKRLIWDSIDFIYDETLNGNVTAAIDAQVTASRLDSTTATAAKTYLGSTRP